MPVTTLINEVAKGTVVASEARQSSRETCAQRHVEDLAEVT